MLISGIPVKPVCSYFRELGTHDPAEVKLQIHPHCLRAPAIIIA